MLFRMEFLVTTRGPPDQSTQILVNGHRLTVPETSQEVFKLPEGEHHFGDDTLEVPPLSIRFAVLEGVC